MLFISDYNYFALSEQIEPMKRLYQSSGNILEVCRDRNHALTPQYLLHGCNCFHAMGAGLAKQIKEAYPGAYEADKAYLPKGDVRKLGNWSEFHTGEFIILNLYTQYYYGKKYTSVPLDYEALTLGLRKFNQHVWKEQPIIAMPRIGCGLAGGDWNKVSYIIRTELSNCIVRIITP